MIMLRVSWGQGQAALTGFEPVALQEKSFKLCFYQEYPETQGWSNFSQALVKL